jgi:hypothetical protein
MTGTWCCSSESKIGVDRRGCGEGNIDKRKGSKIFFALFGRQSVAKRKFF